MSLKKLDYQNAHKYLNINYIQVFQKDNQAI